MGLRPAHCYREDDKPAYSRVAVTVHKRNYIGASPAVRTRQFNMGNPTRKYSHVVDLISATRMQVRDNALESARMNANRYLFKRLTKDGFFMKIRVYPYQILRENKQATGAGADRVTKGMAHPFGKPIGRAVRVKEGSIVMSMLIDQANLQIGKDAMGRAMGKLPGKWSLKIHTDSKSLGTLPKRTRDEKKAEVEVKAEDATAAAAPAAGKAGEKGAAAPAKEAGKDAKKPEAKGKK